MKRFVLLALLLMLSACGLRSESSLRRQFTEHEELVAELLDMQREDKELVRIAPDFTRLENDWSWPRDNIGFSEERWDRYRKLFKQAGISNGLQKDGGYIWFFASSVGLAVSGASRGFVYTEALPSPMVTSFDQCPSAEDVCFIRLQQHWYLFHWAT